MKTALLAEYGHFSDKRIKNIDNGSVFIVDDRSKGGLGSDGKPFGWFCEVYANVIDDTHLDVTLRGHIPRGRLVAAWIEGHGFKIKQAWGIECLIFPVQVREPEMLATLAEAFLSIVRPPARYPERSYKYSCVRLHDALIRLGATLTRFHGR